MNFSEYLDKYHKQSMGLNLAAGYVAQTIYRLFVDARPVGYGKLRHSLTEHLMKNGGHIGASIRPSERGKGYGIVILRELLKKAQEKEITKVLLTCNEDNIASRKMIEANGGKLENIKERCRYRIDLGGTN